VQKRGALVSSSKTEPGDGHQDPPEAAQSGGPPEDRLHSWKEIAVYLSRDVRTVRRWEKNQNLPVHRHFHHKLASVYAYRSELEAWWAEQRRIVDGGKSPTGEAEASLETQEPPQTPGVFASRVWRWLTVIAAGSAIAAAIGYAVLRQIRASADHRTTIAVLPFQNLTGDPAQEFISDGFTEEMITELGALPSAQLGVIARTSSMAYKNSSKTVDQIGRELGVEYVLEGSVRHW